MSPPTLGPSPAPSPDFAALLPWRCIAGKGGGPSSGSGGIVRDLLVREIPTVLMPTQVYAVAALIGATVMVIGMRLHFPVYSSSIAGALLCFIVRYLAIRRAWRLPVAPPLEIPEEDIQQR